jgi:hypothetical protein
LAWPRGALLVIGLLIFAAMVCEATSLSVAMGVVALAAAALALSARRIA